MSGTSAAQASVTVLALAVGAAMAVTDITYRPLRHLVTAVHEAGHAIVALATGRRLGAIRLNRDSSGETVSIGRSKGLGVVLTLLAGYPAPSVLGLAGVMCVVRSEARLWVVGVLVVLGAMLLMLRNIFGVFVLLATAVPLVALTRPSGRAWAEPATMMLSAFLLVAGLRGCLELWRAGMARDDAGALARATGIPAGAWRAFFALCSLAALAWGAWICFQHAGAVSGSPLAT